MWLIQLLEMRTVEVGGTIGEGRLQVVLEDLPIVLRIAGNASYCHALSRLLMHHLGSQLQYRVVLLQAHVLRSDTHIFVHFGILRLLFLAQILLLLLS